MTVDMSGIANQSGAAGVGAVNFASMDIETMMMAVQTERVHLLEEQLVQQMTSVQNQNNQISLLNTLQGELNAASALFKSDAKSDDTIKTPESLTKAFTAAGLEVPKEFAGDKIKKSDVETYSQKTKSQIDSLSNSQQMDMLRLQSLSNKRNEAFETMTNFMKKLQDGRNAIVGNMR